MDYLQNHMHIQAIRTPMNAIIGLNSIAMNNPETGEKTKEYLVKIGASAQHLLNIINNILDMSRIESGRMTIRHEEFSFSKALEQVNTIISGQCRDKGLRYDCRVSGKIDDYYIGDDMKLRQVIINILGNAVKFTPAGGTVTFLIEETARFGLEATRAIRATDRADAKTVPVIALTANAFDEDVQRSMQAGLNAHLSKPVEPDTLYRTLESLIK